MVVMNSQPLPKNNCQSFVDDFYSYIVENGTAVWGHSAILEVLAAILGNNGTDDIATTF